MSFFSSVSGAIYRSLPSYTVETKVAMTKAALYAVSLFSALSGIALYSKNNNVLSSRKGKQICLVGALSLFSAYNLRSEHGRCNAVTKAQYTKDFLGSAALCIAQATRNIWHWKITKNESLQEKAAHQAHLAHEKAMNSWYRLVGSERFVINLTPRSPLLVATKNQPQETLKGAVALQRMIAQAKEQASRADSIYIFNFDKNFDLSKGVCQGMVQTFAAEYHKLRAQDHDCQTAVTKAAELFSQGGDESVCTRQLLHIASQIDEKAFNQRFSDPDIRDQLRWVARSFLGHNLLGSGFTFQALITFSSPDQFSSLPDGIYELNSGYLLHGPSTDQYLANPTNYGHAMALVVEEGEFFIFDPNYGLIKHPNPYRYFEVIRKSDRGVLFCSQIHPPKGSSS